jgi:DNA primase large subunit
MHEKNTIVIGETVVDRDDWVRLMKTLSASRKSSKQIGDKIVMLSDLINQNTVIKIDQDVLFEPGKYTMTADMASTIGKLFEPAATEIDRFMNKYPDFPLSLVITAKGYADGTTIAEGSTLYKELKQMMQLSGNEPDNKTLNKELSNARAKEVIMLFKKFAAERAANKTYLKNVLYIHQGKGEVLPNPKISDYRIDDSRRRVVYLFWSVFPE